MGINQLTELIRKEAPDAISIADLSKYKGQKLSIDISIAIYQWQSVGYAKNIKNSNNKYINHLQGLFYRMINLLEHNIYPICVFEGIPPVIKQKTLEKRKENMLRVKIPSFMFSDCRQLLKILQLHYTDAAGEAEAECAAQTKQKITDAVASEDTDSLTFGAKKLLRGLSSNKTVTEINLSKVLKGFKISHDSFIDLCILLGCDYCGKIPGIGPAKALQLIRKHKSIEKIIKAEHINVEKFDFNYEAARKEFKSPITNSIDKNLLKWKPMQQKQVNELYKFLVVDNLLSEKKVINGIARLEKLSNIPVVIR